MVEAGYVHRDVCWRYVALLPVPPKVSTRNKWTVNPILIDCSSVVKSSEEELSSFVHTALNLLATELEVLKQNTY